MIHSRLRRTVLMTNRLIGAMTVQHFSYAVRAGAWAPRVNLYRYAEYFEVVAELAGVTPGDVAVRALDERHLQISGVRRAPELHIQQRTDSCQQTTLLEIEDGAFARVIEFPTAITMSGVDAAHEHGLLYIRVPLRGATDV